MPRMLIGRALKWIDIDGERVFQNDVVGIAPHGDEVLTGTQTLRNAYLQVAQVVRANFKLTIVTNLAEQDVTLVGRRLAGVLGQPDGIGPTGDSGAIALGSRRTEIAHLVAHTDGGTVCSLFRRHHVASDQVAEGNAIDIESMRLDVIAFLRILVDAIL